MTRTEKLRKKKPNVMKEIQDLNNQQEKITDNMSQAKQQTGDIDMPTLLKKVKVAKTFKK